MRNFHTKLKRKVWERDNYTCRLKLVPGCRGDMRKGYQDWLAGRITRKRAALSVDHLKPTSRGGHWSMENLVTACMPCNLHKGNRTEEEMLELVAETPSTDAHDLASSGTHNERGVSTSSSLQAESCERAPDHGMATRGLFYYLTRARDAILKCI